MHPSRRRCSGGRPRNNVYGCAEEDAKWCRTTFTPMITGGVDRGFVYAVTGAKHVKESRLSAASVRRFHSEPIVLITDDQVESHGFNDVLVVSQFERRFGAKIAMRHCPFSRYIYLDCDCRVIGSLSELFHLLDAFDLALPAALGGYHYELEGCSPAFREHATNMMAVRKCPATDEFFDTWQRWYRYYEDAMEGEGDQRSFRRAAYDTRELRLCTLGDEWSLSPYPGGLLCREVRLVHGRPPQRLDFLEKFANQKLGYRAFLPPFRPLYSPALMTSRDWLSLIASGMLEMAKSMYRRVRKRM
jgi:hypothetical protein